MQDLQQMLFRLEELDHEKLEILCNKLSKSKGEIMIEAFKAYYKYKSKIIYRKSYEIIKERLEKIYHG